MAVVESAGSLRISHRCSVGLRFGLCDGHCIWFIMSMLFTHLILNPHALYGSIYILMFQRSFIQPFFDNSPGICHIDKMWEIFQCYIMYVHYIKSECLLSSLLSDLIYTDVLLRIALVTFPVSRRAYVCQYLCTREVVCLCNCCMCCVHAYTVLLEFTEVWEEILVSWVFIKLSWTLKVIQW